MGEKKTALQEVEEQMDQEMAGDPGKAGADALIDDDENEDETPPAAPPKAPDKPPKKTRAKAKAKANPKSKPAKPPVKPPKKTTPASRKPTKPKASTEQYVTLKPSEILIPKNLLRQTESDPIKDEKLKNSMKSDGLFHAITVTKNAEGRYELCHGKRRLTMAKLLKWKAIECRILDENTRPDEAEWDEEESRENIHILDKARRCRDLATKKKMSQPQIAKKLKISQTMVNRLIGLHKLTKEERQMMIDGTGSPRLWMDLAKADDDERARILKELKAGKSVPRTQSGKFDSVVVPSEGLPEGMKARVTHSYMDVTVRLHMNHGKDKEFDEAWKWLNEQKKKVKIGVKAAWKTLPTKKK